jgi:hypothetical protein
MDERDAPIDLHRQDGEFGRKDFLKLAGPLLAQHRHLAREDGIAMDNVKFVAEHEQELEAIMNEMAALKPKK